MLEIARQSVPDGYGNSYFWVKPPRIVPADLVRTVRGRLDFRGEEVRPFDRDDAVAAARFFRDAGITTIGVCFLHSYANDAHERAMLEVLEQELPRAPSCRCPAEVLREYREYERSVTTLVDAAVKPKVGAYVTNIRTRLDEIAPGVPFYVMKSNGGVLSAGEVVHQPITTMLSGPAAGALGAALIAGTAGFDRVLTCDGGGTSTDVTVVIDGEPTLTTEGSVGDYPSQDPDDRRRHRRRRRRLDRLALARGHAQGRPAVGRRRPRPDVLPARRRPADRHRRARRPRPDPAAPAGRGDPAVDGRGAAPGSSRLGARAGPRPWSGPRPASSRSPRGTRPTRCAR